MTNVAIDFTSAPRVGLADAKATLSSLVAQVERTGEAQVIMRYGKPAAAIVPLPREKSPAGRARGSLASYADASKTELEKNAFAHAMVMKHANPA